MERHQAPLLLAAVAAGALLGLLLPQAAGLAPAITPLLGLVLLATFLAVPFRRLAESLRDWRFLLLLGAVNFVLVPALVWALTRLVAHDAAVLLGAALVLLTPCIDYVIVFARMAGAAAERLLAAAPVLLVAQALLLPVLLPLITGRHVEVEPEPFVEALLLLIVLPLLLAAALQWAAARWRPARSAESGLAAAMVPLMMATLLVVVASQLAAIGAALPRLLPAAGLFAVFAVAVALLVALLVRLARVDAPRGRALVLSAVTRNSLVVLPLALALPAPLVPLVVVTQTVVELVALSALVRLLPALLPGERTRG
ncbi:arsenic resistance protein [Arenivirga flava]|uniref:Arsenic resistance protein n=2 Tax=Arenivirga flava TaxID=1930060 RepID=A0AA37UHR2_9MICO|nr:arsenic resistance protein [Arenivirga flava]